MIKLKELVSESAWNRKFGEPLPTLEDTTKKHQTEASRPGEPEHKEGDVWQTDSGWAAWRKGDDSAEYGIQSKKAADKWAKGEEVGYDDGDHDEKEPAGKLSGGDFERDGGDDGDDGDDVEGPGDFGSGKVDDYGVEAGSLEDDEDAQQNVQNALQGAEKNLSISKLRDAGHEKMADVLAADDVGYDDKLKVYMRAIGESKKTAKKHPLRATYERIGG
jgi:hypothetical protein